MNRSTSGRRTIALATTLVLVGGVALAQRVPQPAIAFSRGQAPVAIGPVPRGLRDTTAEACAECHAEIVGEWRGSLHASAWTDDVFQVGYETEPLAFCRNCHAPLNRGGPEPDERAVHEGVSCSVCHVRDAHVLGATAVPTAAAESAHAMRAATEIAASAYCAGCHQFDFPDAQGHRRQGSSEPMQDTFGEWARSAVSADRHECQECHMPWRVGANGRRHRSHAFPGVRDAALMHDAVRVSVRAWRDRGQLTIDATLTPGVIGHSFPTGDLFRAIEFSANCAGSNAIPIRITMLRAFGGQRGRSPSPLRHQLRDDRVPPPGPGAAHTIRGRLDCPAGTVIHWSLEHLLSRAPDARFANHNRALVREGDVISPP